MKKTIILDFDGVINSYKGWTGDTDLPDPPVSGAKEAIESYHDAGFQVHIMSTRAKNAEGRTAIDKYLRDMGVEMEALNAMSISDQKIPALLIIDDRAYQFNGIFPSPEDVSKFKPWNR